MVLICDFNHPRFLYSHVAVSISFLALISVNHPSFAYWSCLTSLALSLLSVPHRFVVLNLIYHELLCKFQEVRAESTLRDGQGSFITQWLLVNCIIILQRLEKLLHDKWYIEGY